MGVVMICAVGCLVGCEVFSVLGEYFGVGVVATVYPSIFRRVVLLRPTTAINFSHFWEKILTCTRTFLAG